ncbi:MAG: endonuclease [Flavipsychrobacter sp.]|jgi:hypothetical protein|nr:endonuclease [Flavipsychrobacter sp.]
MNLFFHHVGQLGATKDFPKTVFRKHNIDVLVSEGVITDGSLLEELRSKFPTGEFNCWGVPSGASVVIRNLNEGDYVLLVKSSRIDGDIPVLCPVKIFWRAKLETLSEYLWQDSKFPFIFFFNTIDIELMWVQFIEDLGYKNNFSPRGNFYKVDNGRLEKFGGVEPYLQNIINKYSDYRNDNVDLSRLKEDGAEFGLFDLQEEEDRLIALTKSMPNLVDNSLSRRLVSITKRDRAFSILIKRHYNFKCAVCNSSLKSPNEHPAVHAAHIFPKEKMGSDDLRNGICLCLLHHWAFDAGWFSIDDNYYIILHENIPRTEDYKDIYKWENSKINLPKDANVWPHRLFLDASRRNYGFYKS